MREMKDSGIEWIGKVPVEWKIDNPQYHFSQRKDRAKQGMVQLTASQKIWGDYSNRIHGEDRCKYSHSSKGL